MTLPKEFIHKVKTQHADIADNLLEALVSSEATLSIRHHLIKGQQIFENMVPWCPHASYLSSRPSFTLDPLFHAGTYYVQEASSMILYHILQFLQIKENPCVLDLCAAPGGKSTLVLDYLQGSGLLVANEVIKSRANILEENIIKWGYTDAVVTNNDPKDFNKIHSFFDVAIIDAPCSGEGMFRKDEAAIKEWSEDHVHHCAVRQQRILYDVIPSLKEGGYLIYSTCTFNNEENIENIHRFNEQCKLQSIDIPMHEDWRIKKIVYKDAIGYQFYPGITNGEGFFVAVMKKIDSEGPFQLPQMKKSKLSNINKTQSEAITPWVDASQVKIMMTDQGNVYAYNSALYDTIEPLLHMLNAKYSGVMIGNLQKNVFIPHHALALSNIVNPTVPKIELDKNEALLYLNRNLPAVNSTTKSWLLACYKGIPIGWLKNLGHRINNYYPTEWRIKMDVGPHLNK